MNKGLFFILALPVVFSMDSCKEVPPFEIVEQDPKVEVRFQLMNGTEEVDIGDFFTDSEGYGLELKTFKFYVSQINLEGDQNAALSEVELVNFDEGEDGQVNPFRQSYSYILAPGTYESLRFDLGLNPDLNLTDPSTLDRDNPLSSGSGMHWDWATLYVFIMLEAGIDTNADGRTDANIALHTGLDTLFRPNQLLTFDAPLTLEAFDKKQVLVSIDWNKLFHVEGPSNIDLGEVPFVHANVSVDALEMCERLTDNFTQAMTVSVIDSP